MYSKETFLIISRQTLGNSTLVYRPSIKGLEITKEEWTIELGHLTPIIKVKRKIILGKHKNLYNKICDL